MKLFIIAIIGAGVVFAETRALSQINVPLPGRTVVKLLPDPLRSQVYALNQANGAVPGTLLALNPTNGAILHEITVNTNPTDLALTPAGDTVFVINAGSRTITKVDLNSFAVVSEQAISTPNTYSVANPLYLVATAPGAIYYTDGAWGPEIYFFNYDAGTNLLVYDTGSYQFAGAGGMVVSPNLNVLYIWQQYGWSAGSDSSAICSLSIQNGGLTTTATGPQQARDPLDTPILTDVAGRWVFNKSEMVWAADVAFLVTEFSDNIYAITPDGSLAFGPTEIFDTKTSSLILNLPFSATVQAVTRDQKTLIRYNAATTNLVLYNLDSLIAPSITQPPTNQVIYSGNNAALSVGVTGLAPMTYLWFFNGTNFATTTNSQVTVPNFQAANVGNYSVMITNAFGSATSSNAALTVAYVAPMVLGQPASSLGIAGASASLSVTVAGSLPMSFQWQVNGTNIGGGTSATLTLTNLQLANQGSYEVVISNAYGSVTSSNAYLTVVDVAEALNTTNLIWTSGGDVPWCVQDDPGSGDPWGFGYSSTHDGFASMQSGNTTAGQQSILQTIITGPATLTFWWQAVSISPPDILTCSLNGVPQFSISYITGWEQPTLYLGAGTNLLQWDYTTVEDAGDKATAWLDQVNVVSGGTPPFITLSPSAQVVSIGSNAVLNVAANGTPPFTYQWQLNGTNLDGATNATLALSNLRLADGGDYVAVVANDFGATNSASAYLNVMDFAAALNTSNLVWTTGGDAPWFVETAVTEDGVAAAQSGIISSGQQSILQTSVAGPGTLTFWWNVSSEGVADYLNFSINEVEQARISGVVINGFYGWQWVTAYVGAGIQTLQWAYSKTDSGVSISGRDSGWLDEVSFVPGGTAPFVSLNPTNQVSLVGSNVTLNASVLGTPPLNYQWQFNGNNLPGATNVSLVLSNVQLAEAGNYLLLATNAFGVTNTATASLVVLDVTGALNATNLVWTSSGNVPWFPENTTTHDGVAALQSGAISGNQQSTIQTTATGPGTLTFWWKVWSETNNDYVNFSLDGLEQSRISGYVDWQPNTIYLAPGPHALAWSYSKNGTINGGFDAAWLDQVAYVTGATAAFIALNPTDQTVLPGSNATFTVTAQGTPPLNYVWLFDGNPLPNATNHSLTITGVQSSNLGSYAVVVSNSYGTAASASAYLYEANLVGWGAGATNTMIMPNYGQSRVPANVYATAIAAGGYHSLALQPNGRVIAWGNNTYGQTNVPSTLTNVVAISAGLYHSLALRSNGTVAAWGYSSYGQTIVPAAATNVAAIAAGWNYNLALSSNGTVVAWGAVIYNGQVLVSTNLTGVAAIAAGGYHSLALRTNGTVVATGWNAFGQTNVPAGLSNVVAIAAGGSNSIALKNDGTLVAWGANGHGQTNPPEGLSNVVAISAGAGHVLALKADGTLAAWGQNGNGQTNVPGGLTNVAAIAAGGYHSLALVNSGPVTFLSQPYSQTIYKGSNALFAPALLGAAPMNYQWLENGATLPSGTNAWLAITNAQLTDAGDYQLVVSNAFGAVTSAAAGLTVYDTAPFFFTPPTNAAVLQNGNITLTASVGGLPPFNYQWLFNGAAISQATNAAFTVTNAQSGNEGNYSLVASNAFGMVTSSNAFLNVIDVPEALGQPNWLWQILYSPGWFAESTNTHDGFAAAASGPLAYGNQTVLQTYVAGPGTLSFWWSGQRYVTMSFQIDGATQTSEQLYFGSEWSQFTYDLPAKVHALTWTAANQYFPYGNYTNQGFLDQVVFTPGITPVSLTAQPVSQTVAAGSNVTFGLGTSGTPPMTYQWYCNGKLLAGATSSSLTVNNVQAGNAGSYQAVVSNAGGTVTSSNALLAVTLSAPTITTQPNGAPVMLGGTVTFSSGAAGTSPICYQWLLNNLPIAGATSPVLTLNNVQYADAGNYSLLASNIVGTTVSSNASLNAYSTADLGATLDNPAITWSTTNVPWFPQTNTTYDGVSAAQSGVISGSQQSTLQGVVTGPAMVTFWWEVNCDSFWDSLSFAVNGTTQASITGTVGWQQVTNYIGSGSQTLQWNLYPVHGAFAGGTGWVDQVQIIPISGTPVVITANPLSTSVNAGNNLTLSINATGTPALLYQWQFNGTNLPGATNAVLTLNNVQAGDAGTYAVAVTNDFGSAISSNATLVVNPSAPVITAQPANQTNVVNNSASFMVMVMGTTPFTYQWYFNGAAIVGAISNVLVLSNPQLTNAGNYSVIISNQYGQATSRSANLSLVPTKVVEFWPYVNYPGNPGPYRTPSSVGDVVSIAAGALHTMALRTDGTVLVWGTNVFGQTNVPAGLSNVVAIAAGNTHCLALRSDGTLAAWGDNGYGQGSIPIGLSNVVAICSGPTYNLALTGDGTVAGWGNDINGQTDIPAGLTNVQAIFAGYYNGFARLADGSLVQWGTGPVWQHDGTNTQLQVAGGLSNVVAVAAGGFSGWSLQSDGTALAHGWYDGIAPFTNAYSGLTSWSTGMGNQHAYSNIAVQVACGTGYPPNDYALLLDNHGQITQAGALGGPGSPSTVPYIGSNPGTVTAIAAGYEHAAALVGGGLPHFIWSPISCVVYSGATVVFSAGAVGQMPLNYQWQFNGTNLDCATNALLVLTNVPLTAAGIYACLVTNAIGAATSLNATLTVPRSTLRFDNTLAFSTNGFGWQLDQLSGHGSIVILVSTNLVDWMPVFTNPPVTGSLQLLDPEATNQPTRFYRAVEQ